MAPTAEPVEPETWAAVAKLVCLGTIFFIMLLFVLTIFSNFIADEAHQPLDFYSNKLRTRPYWLMLLILFLGGGIGGVYNTGQTNALNEGLPEVAIACYLEALVIGISALVKESAGTALTSMLLFLLVGSSLCLVSLVPTLPVNRPGVYYAVIYFIVNIIFVYWLKTAVKRHIHVDGQQKVVPPGSERLFICWYEVVCKWNPVMAVLTSMAYGVEYLLSTGEYGWACALAYYVIACVLLVGCCHQFKTGTALEND